MSRTLGSLYRNPDLALRQHMKGLFEIIGTSTSFYLLLDGYKFKVFIVTLLFF